MSPPAELSFDEILKFMLLNNGKVTNHELVKHFKVFLMNPDMRDEARNTFKKHVNALAIIKNQNNEKWLILKKKYLNHPLKLNEESVEIPIPEPTVVVTSEVNTEPEIVVQPVYKPPPPLQLNQDFNILASIIQDTSSAPSNPAPSNQAPSNPAPSNPVSTPKPMEMPVCETIDSLISHEETPPKVHPRRRSSDKSLMEKRSSIPNVNLSSRSSIPSQDMLELSEKSTLTLSSSRSESMLIDSDQKISVKERKQMFNRMASEGDVLKSQKLSFNNSNVDEEDRASLENKESDPLDSKQKQWILCAARGEYHSLAKMCKENAKLVRTKDPFTTAMHWACKRGDENLVKLLASIHRHIVNERSGYTPLHIAMQFRHENVYRLLVEVYDADPNMRDWSGKKARQYLVHMDTSLSPGSYRKSESNIRRSVTSLPSVKVSRNYVQQLSKNEKEGFLRIGSLNVRVKKTTEAFSNFLGVGATRTGYVPKRSDTLDRRSDDGELHKSWGSADNIQKDDKAMPRPLSTKVRRRGASGRRGVSSHSRSTPSTPDQPRAKIGVSEENDTDSDTAAGFHSAWRQPQPSNS